MLPSISLKSAVPVDRWHKTNFLAGLLLFGLSVTPFVQNPWLPSQMLGVLGLGMMFMGLGDWKLIRTRLRNDRLNIDQTDWLGHAFKILGLFLLLWFAIKLGLLLSADFRSQ